MSNEVLTYILSGAVFLLSVLFGVVWTLLRDESKEHATKLEQKATEARVNDLEVKFDKDLSAMRESNERLVDKLQARHEKDMDSLSAGFNIQITGVKELVQNMERNILQQLAIMYGSRKSND